MPILFLIFIALILFFIIYPKIKKSDKVEKYTKDLLEDIKEENVDDKITNIKEGVKDLEHCVEENEKKRKELGLESEKINKFIGKDLEKDE